MNLVFDLGNVVVRWDPQAVVSSILPAGPQRAVAVREIFSHPDWLELDRGTLAFEDAVGRAVSRTGLPGSKVRELLDAVPPSLEPIPETVALLRRLHAAGYPLYALSNMAHASIDHLERTHDFFRLFAGKVVSCRVNLCKPQPEIFRMLLENFSLRPEQTVFTDDLEANVSAARALGIRAVRFESAAQCERELLRLAGGA